MKDNIITVLVSVIASIIFSALVVGKVPSTTTNNTQDLNQAIENYLLENPSKIREALELAAKQEQIEAQKRIAENYKNNWKLVEKYVQKKKEKNSEYKISENIIQYLNTNYTTSLPTEQIN